ncbi:hypothetical protein H8959_017691 [Pygathrix nigripes]
MLPTTSVLRSRQLRCSLWFVGARLCSMWRGGRHGRVEEALELKEWTDPGRRAEGFAGLRMKIQPLDWSQTLRTCPAQGLRATGLASYGMRGSWHGSPLPAVVLPSVLQTALSPLTLCQAWRRAVPYGVPSQRLRNQEASLVPKGVLRAWHPGPLQNGLWTHLEKEELLGLKPTPGGLLLLRSFWDPHPSRPFLCTLLPPPLRIFPPLRCSAWRWWG